MNAKRNLDDQQLQDMLSSLVPHDMWTFIVSEGVIPALIRTRSGTWEIPTGSERYGFKNLADLEKKLGDLQRDWRGYVRITTGGRSQFGTLKTTFLLLC